MARKIEVQILGDSRDLERAYGRAGKASSGFGSMLGGALKTGAIAAAAGIGIAVVAVDKFAKAAIAEQAVDARMVSQLKALGVNYDQHAAHISHVINSEEKLSGFTKEDLVGSFTALARVTKGDVNAALTDNAIVADIARGKNIELSAATMIYTKAALGNVGALRRQGFDVQKVTTATDALRDSHGKVTQAMKDQAKASDLAATKASLVATLQQKFAGQAAAYGNTAAGAMDRFHNAVHDTEVSLGRGLLPTIAKVAGVGASLISHLQESLGKAHGFKAKLDVVWTGLQEAAQRLVAAISGAMRQVDWSATGRAIVDGVQQGLSQAKEIGQKLLAILNSAMGQVNWEQVGSTVGPAIAAGLVAALATLLSVGFWLRHWQEMLAIALAVIPIARLGGLGLKIVEWIASPVVRLLGPLLGKGIGLAGDLVLRVATRLGERLGLLFLDLVVKAGQQFAKLPGVIGSAVGNLGGYVAGKLGSFKTFVIKALAFDVIIHAAVQGAKAVASGIVNGVTALPTLGSRLVLSLLNGIGAAIATAASNAYHWAVGIGGRMVGGIVDGLAGLPGRVGSALKNGLSGAASWAGGVLKGSGNFMWTKHAIGEPMAQGVIDGWMLGSASLPSKMKDTLRNAIEAARTAIGNARGVFSGAWSQLTQDALAAFDAATNRMMAKLERQRGALTASEKKLQDLQNSHDETGRQKAISDAQAGLAAANAAVAAAQAAAAAGMSPADQQALADAQTKVALAQERVNAAVEKYGADSTQAAQATLALHSAQNALASKQAAIGGQAGQDLQAATDQQVAAQQALDDALYQEQVANLQKQADAERAAKDKRYANKEKELQAQRDLERRHFEEHLVELEAQLEREGTKRKQAQAKIIAMLNAYGVSYKQAGLDLGLAFARGLRESEKEVEKSAAALAAVVARYLKTASPSELGPMSDLPTWWKGFAPALVSGLDTRMIQGTVSDAASPTAPASMGGFQRGGYTIEVHIHGAVIGTSLEKATDEIYAQLLRKQARNGSLQLR